MGEIARIKHRLLVVNGVTPEGLDLLLLTREASAANLPGTTAEILRCAGAFATEEIAPTVRHKRVHIFPGGREYALGAVITEEEAYAAGYHLPYIETFCADLALILTQMGLELANEARTSFLRAEKILKPKQDLIVTSPQDKPYKIVDIFAVQEQGMIPNLNNPKLDLDHPVRLFLYNQNPENNIPVECQFHVHGARHPYHFMTYILAIKK